MAADPRLSAMIAHSNMRSLTKDLAKDLMFAECYIETERLVLRPLHLDDYDDYAMMLSDPDAFTYSERGPMTSDEIFTRLLRHVGHWVLLDHGLFAVFEKDSGRFVGEVGFGDFRRQLGDRFDAHPEACWTIARPYQGRGYASEAARAALDFVTERTGSRRTVCLVHHKNDASIHIATKLGFHPFDERVYRGYRAMLFSRDI
ncbi:GNAT family N-acetyltransferase [Sphingomicrobium nitratireducens]|uniref:GNAT family N-acetyltransferase n=1 Tax=Sphingomicrobium nitratireducens TaxID=2964666 RepID=UPI00223F717E|nr:GNAT family N-acetyltransferase [Sphingomicrobium nitratireducens]